MTEFGVLPCPRHSVVGNLFLPDGGFPEFAAVAKHGNGARFRVSSCRGSQVRILAAAPLSNVQRAISRRCLQPDMLLLLLCGPRDRRRSDRPLPGVGSTPPRPPPHFSTSS